MSGVELACCIAADLCPHGMLPLAWAATAGGGTGSVTGVLLMALFGAAAAYSLFLTAKIARDAHEAPPALSTVWEIAGLPQPKAVDALVALLCAGCCVFYAAFATDIFHSMTSRVAPKRYIVLAALVVMPLAPLCLGDDLSILKYSSYAGLGGVCFAAGYLLKLGIEALAQPEPTSSWLFTAKPEPRPPSSPFRITPGTAVLANTLVVGYLCHYNALQYYRELRDASPPRYVRVVAAAIAATTFVFATSLVGGKWAFGTSTKPNVLNNLTPAPGATLAKLGTGIAILSGFPLMFAGLKAALDGALPDLDDDSRVPLFVGCLAGVASAAAVATEEDVGLAIELLGSTLGVAAVYVVPGLAAYHIPQLPHHHRLAGAALAATGAVLAVASTALTLAHRH